MADKKKTEEKKEPEAKVYTIPLRDAFNFPRKKRTEKAVKIVAAYLKRHLKSVNVKLSAKLNEALWARGIEKPPRKIRVKVTEEEGVYTADVL
ncbi:MAG: 50S ribosomal protein L31e [Candidatus Altiarchaeota archaeon]